MILFLLLNLIDAITTYIGLTTGKCDEANLILSKLFEINIYLGLSVKIILAVLIAILVNKYKPKLFKILNAIFMVIIFWNLILILRWNMSDNLNSTIKFAKAFLDDKDAKDKAFKYYYNVVR